MRERFALVDLDQYNLPLEKVLDQWTVTLVAKNAQSDGGVFLRVKNDREYYVDKIDVSFPRRPDAGLGILLQEVAGGREDGLGITLVNGLVEGGSADGTNLLPGDSIINVGVRRSGSGDGFGGMSETEDIVSVSTECLGYDATVDAILGLPPAETDQEEFLVTVKRLRRKPKTTVNLQFPPGDDRQDVSIELFSGEKLRQAMLTRGIKLNDPNKKRFDTKNEGNCGAFGLCTTCVVSVLKGGELLNPMRDHERQILEGQPRWRLACKSIVGYGMREGEVTLRVHPNQWEY